MFSLGCEVSCMSTEKRRIIFKSFVKCHFKYCPKYMRNFSHIKCFSIHDQKIHCLTVEIHKVANNLSVGDFKNLFDFKDKYTVHIHLINTELKDKNSIRYFGAVIWNTIPINIIFHLVFNNI